MKIVQFSLLTVLAYVLKCNGQQTDCVGALNSSINALDPLIDAATLVADAIDCQNSGGLTVPLSPDIVSCITGCNANQNPNALLCMTGCWNTQPLPPPACLSVFVDISIIIASLVLPEATIANAFLDGLDFLQCILSNLSVTASSSVVTPSPTPNGSCDNCTSVPPGSDCCQFLGLAPTCVCDIGTSTECSANGGIFCPA